MCSTSHFFFMCTRLLKRVVGRGGMETQSIVEDRFWRITNINSVVQGDQM
jgi:hypothetical protein